MIIATLETHPDINRGEKIDISSPSYIGVGPGSNCFEYEGMEIQDINGCLLEWNLDISSTVIGSACLISRIHFWHLLFPGS